MGERNKKILRVHYPHRVPTVFLCSCCCSFGSFWNCWNLLCHRLMFTYSFPFALLSFPFCIVCVCDSKGSVSVCGTRCGHHVLVESIWRAHFVAGEWTHSGFVSPFRKSINKNWNGKRTKKGNQKKKKQTWILFFDFS